MTGLPEVIVVIPAAAVFLAGIGARSTPELDALADAAVAELAPVAAADAVGVLAARGTTRDSDPGAPAATTDPTPWILGSATAEGRPPPAGWAVAQHLLAQCGVRPPLVTMTVDTFRADQELLIVAADGSAARGDRAPRVGIPGQPLDDRIMASLASGRLSGLGGISDTEAARVGCADAAVWRGLAALGDDWVSETARLEHPLGVTYFVARLRRGSRSW